VGEVIGSLSIKYNLRVFTGRMIRSAADGVSANLVQGEINGDDLIKYY